MPTLFQSTLQDASFAGVSFYVLDANVKVGQRAQTHQYPFRDSPYTEPLGRQATTYQITGYLVGDEVNAQYKQMLAAIAVDGPATLIHPSLGAFQVICLNCDTIQNIQGRYVELRFSFVEAGQILYPTTGSDSSAASATTAQAGQTQQESDTTDTEDAATSTPDSVASSATPTTLSSANDATLNDQANPDTAIPSGPTGSFDDNATADTQPAAAATQSTAETNAMTGADVVAGFQPVPQN